MNPSSYRFDLDMLKGLSIIAVVLYHIGWLSTGYLGVDVFFAINGFFILPSLLKRIGGGDFQYVTFILKRIMRLWPLVLLASAITLALGAYGMLPDDFENLSQSVIASDLMSNNILAAITTKNYWDATNEFKPLMHFWYVGILVEFYVLMPLLLLLAKGIAKVLKSDYHTVSMAVIWVLFIVSLGLYLFSDMSQGDKFYYLPCRLFELLAGGLVGVYISRERGTSVSSSWGILAMLSVVLLMFGAWYLPVSSSDLINPVLGQVSNTLLISPVFLLMSSVFVTCIVLLSTHAGVQLQRYLTMKGIAFLGKMSFSIFVWHQIILAFYRYFISNDMSWSFGICLWIATILLSFLTYYGIEKKVQPTWRNFGFSVLIFMLTVLPAGWVYVNAGVIRDVPELGVKKGSVHRGMFAEYCDRVYQYNRDFSDNKKLKVLVEGVSFGRDFANVLLESDWADKIELSYIFKHNERYKDRYAACDLLFTFSSKTNVPDYVWAHLNDSSRIIGLGTKNFGVCNGQVYQKRHRPDYFDLTTTINPNFYTLNEQWKQEWGVENYVDFIQLSTANDGNIRVFTDDHRFISQDCRHLTQDGAKWFAKKLQSDVWFNHLMKME